MSSLKTFLRSEAERLKASAPSRDAIKQDWIRAVADLLNQLEDWIRQSDPEGVLKLSRANEEYSEEGLGVYTVPSLRIQLESRGVCVYGKARKVVDRIQPRATANPRQADGLAVITDVPYPHHPPKFYIYRLVEPDGDHWFIRHPMEKEVKPLDREWFETVLVVLLK